MQKGSLKNHLFRTSLVESPSWDRQLNIAIEAARGLAFLRTLDNPVIDRSFKSSNILLDENYNAKISDFGFTNFGYSDTSRKVVVGGNIEEAYAYIAPECLFTGHFGAKSEVYGFGVVLLEMLTGLRACDSQRPSEQRNLAVWFKQSTSSEERKLKTIMDARMESQYSSKAMSQAEQLILKCLESKPDNRPSMKDVLEQLEQIKALEETTR